MRVTQVFYKSIYTVIGARKMFIIRAIFRALRVKIIFTEFDWDGCSEVMAVLIIIPDEHNLKISNNNIL